MFDDAMVRVPCAAEPYSMKPYEPSWMETWETSTEVTASKWKPQCACAKSVYAT